MTGRAIIIGTDLLVRTRLEAAARAAGLEVTDGAEAEPVIVLADLDGPAAIESIGAMRRRWPGVRVAGFLSHVDADGRARAQALGIEVYPRGASTDAQAIIAGDNA